MTPRALERHFVGPSSAKLALARRFGQPDDVKLELEWRFTRHAGIKLRRRTACRRQGALQPWGRLHERPKRISTFEVVSTIRTSDAKFCIDACQNKNENKKCNSSGKSGSPSNYFELNCIHIRFKNHPFRTQKPTRPFRRSPLVKIVHFEHIFCVPFPFRTPQRSNQFRALRFELGNGHNGIKVFPKKNGLFK